MARYKVSIIPPGHRSSTYHGQCEAASAQEAVSRYINQDPKDSSGAAVAQRDGGIVIVGEVDYSNAGTYRAYGLELFRVAPTQPVPVERAQIVGRVEP